ncbi:hypothetical protein ETAE_2257 [Edwardsiella piscicida]|uniref:Uncharacterized protein n=1 Tax=Edwardsiella piscicida TaxID=1263550 RepID=A0AAU8PQ16_EDWPI|nr:hypothetical protein ETAE_2257 [Edwardsiella tarda EIB202]GBK57031.1 hypothetical protein JFPO14_contig00003-0228 [Edwardsiella piscicida]
MASDADLMTRHQVKKPQDVGMFYKKENKRSKFLKCYFWIFT